MLVKSISAVACAAVVAGAIAAFPGFIPGVEAHSSLPTINTAAKADRLDAKTYGTGCSTQGWPHFELACLRNAKSPLREARQVRIVSTDRMEVAQR